ncbi:uncharacterized protein [Henckelia pumila]|uniref:uncharacterized protein n=1 Tax=Henckelia pumila TaxID=405737 RepID=UPI003C6E675F
MARGGGGNQAPNPNPIVRAFSEDSSSPYFLQNGDHPGLKLVSHLLVVSNYNTWSRAMIVALTAKNKLGFIDFSIQCPRSDDLLYGSWIRCNSMVISWLLNSITREIADSLMYMTTASEIWTDLRDRFHQSNASRVYQIKRYLSELQQGSMDVTSYYTRLRTLWDELRDYQPNSVCNCGSTKEWVNYQNQECVMQFLMGLNESYAQVRAQILMSEPLPIITKKISLVVQEERQRSIHCSIHKVAVDSPTGINFVSSPVTIAAATSTKPQNSLFNVAVAAYMRPFQRSNGGKLDKMMCSYCHFTNHTVDKCFKLHGFPP